LSRVFLLPRVLWWRKAVRGLFLDGCITDSQLDGCTAHAHMAGRFKGWICFAPGEEVSDLTLLHEVAHLEADSGHTWRWKRRFLELAEEHSPWMLAEVEADIAERYTSQPRVRRSC
jgi:hypothetical protein